MLKILGRASFTFVILLSLSFVKVVDVRDLEHGVKPLEPEHLGGLAQNEDKKGAVEQGLNQGHQDGGQILNNPKCKNEIPSRCEGNRQPSTDLEALDCILNHKREEVTELNSECNHALWIYRKTLMEEEGFLGAVHAVCRVEIEDTRCLNEKLGDQGAVLCIIENKDKIKSEDCRDQVSLVERVMFSDFELIGRFAQNCKADIAQFKCGRNDLKDDKAPKLLPSSQGKTIECLSDKIENLNEACKIEILRVAELQADDYHLDRALYFNCRDDRETFCKEIGAGNGRVYKCLLQNKMEQRMSDGCRAQLLRRQHVGWHDYKASGLAFTCKSEIKKFRCRKGASESDKNVRLAQILLCLENATHLGQEMNGECVEEMIQHRKSLMEDFKATPELLAACSRDRETFCKGGRSLNGKTIHCLMQHAMSPRREDRINDDCRKQLEELLKLTDVSENWNVDPVLKEKCQPVVLSSSCRDVPTSRVMSCLMHVLTSDSVSSADSHAMTDDCETALLQIQYFMTRQFTIDNVLYESCRTDAKQVCGIAENWSDGEFEGNEKAGGIVLSCLYRNLEKEDNKEFQVSKKCGEKVREAMRIRAFSVRLNPELEEPCLEDLALLCSEKTKQGEELDCLQKNLQSVSSPCKKAVAELIQIEIKDPSVDPYLWKYCENMIEKCAAKSEGGNSKAEKGNEKESKDSMEDEEEDDEEDTVLQCLIKLKPEMKSKLCRARVEHLQLLQLKNFQFSPKFKAACHADVIRRCTNEKPITASRLVSCLSEMIWNDTVGEQGHRISKGCRKQVKYLTLSKVQLEDKSLDEGTFSLCKDYVRQYCKDVPAGGGRIFECLRSQKDLIPRHSDCFASLFKLQQNINQDSTLDAYLTNECSVEIKTFCSEKALHNEIGSSHGRNLLTCLKLNSNQEGFDQNRCGRALRARLVEQNSDVRLNPRLQVACGKDIPKFCAKVQFGEGRILECLKKQFVQPGTTLSVACRAHVEDVLRGAAQTDIRLDYTLTKMCHKEIETSCKTTTSSDGAGGDGGKVEACLMELFRLNRLSPDCRVQVQLLIQSTVIDIHVDPVLNRACAIDLLKRCDGVPPGEGRLVSCLLTELEREKDGGKSRLSQKCSKLLSARSEMFEMAGKPLKVDSIQALYTQVKESPQKNYFLIVAMSMVGAIFVFGLFCGRVTKRKTAAKDK